MPPRLILASASAGRRALLQRLRLPFEVHPANIDETPRPTEPPGELARRLAGEKARAVASGYPDALVIGSDQVGVCRGRRLGKPGTSSHAEEQLLWMQGHIVLFYSGLCLSDRNGRREWLAVETCEVQMRSLSSAEVRRYVALDQPLASAGSFLAESLGTLLFERIRSDDPTTLLGLPLIRLGGFLREAGLDPLEHAASNAPGQ